MDREAEKIKARKSRAGQRYAQVRKCEGTSKSMGLKGGRWVCPPGHWEHASKGFKRRMVALVRLADQADQAAA